MLKTSGKSLLILIIFTLILSQLPVSLAADYYGTIHGKALDRNGNVLSGVKITLLDGEHKVVGNTVSDAKGEFEISKVSMAMSEDIFMIHATYSASGGSWSSDTAYFNVISAMITVQDVTFPDYPSSGIGGLYGIVSDNEYWSEVPATVYLENGMFFIYPGNRYDQWSFDNLPQGKYVIWAERNVGNLTYASPRYNVTVRADDKAYLPILLAMVNPVAYHQQPAPLKNVVHGTIGQKNGASLPGAKVELYLYQGGSPGLIATTCSDVNGQYQFDNVYVDSYSSQYLVRVTFDADGAQRTQDSDKFTVYYSNTLGVTHDYDVPITIGYVTTGSASIRSVPAGARVSIDGVDSGHVTPYNFALKTGTHWVELSMDGYFSDTSTLQVQPETDLAITRTLKQSTGNLSLAVNPASAQIYFDGQLAGTGELTLAKKSAGEHSYLLVCDGYHNESGTVNIVPGESVTKDINMVASPDISLTYLAYLISSIFEAVGHIF